MLRALRIASKKNAVIDGARVRVYKAGTKTYNMIKPKKSKNIRMMPPDFFSPVISRGWG